MHLYQATASSTKELPLTIIEELFKDHHSMAEVAENGIIHSERIPYLAKVYVLEPAVKQVYLACDLHRVSLLSKCHVKFPYPLSR